MEALIIILKILVTFIAALIFGIERQRSHKPVSFGTFIFVSLGACALGIIAMSNLLINSISLLSSVVTGIGFLGAGALIRGPDKVFGFTTAAAIWLFAIFGLTIGIGEYVIGFSIYTLGAAVILGDKYLEKKGIGSYQRKLTVTTSKIIKDKEINTHLVVHTKQHKLLGAELNKGTNEMTLTYIVEGTRENLNKMIHTLYNEPWLKSAKVE